jgi:hypothetical protein
MEYGYSEKRKSKKHKHKKKNVYKKGGKYRTIKKVKA